MKNLTKLFAIIALVAVIGFSFAVCDLSALVGGGGTDGGGGGIGLNGTWVNSKSEE